MENREDGINLVRCVALLLVFGCHYFLYNGYYNVMQKGGWMLNANAFRGICLSCNGIYMMLTGYLKSDKPVNLRYFKCILTAVVTYGMMAAISIPVRHFWLGQSKSFSEWTDIFLDYGGVYYGWYVKMYVGLILVSPILNACVREVKDDRKLLLFTGLLVMATSLSNATTLKIFPSYWELAYPLSYYMIGATIKRIKPRIKKWMLGLVILLMAYGMGAATLLSTDKQLKYAIGWGHGTILTMIIGVAIFLLLYDLKTPKWLSKVAGFIAKGAFPAYMLSNLTDAWIYKLVPAWQSPNHYFIGFILLTIPTYLAWTVIGNVFNIIINFICRNKKSKKNIELKEN